MPIRPENRVLYPADWKRISLEIRKGRAYDRCEWSGALSPREIDVRQEGQRCQALNGVEHPATGSRVVLTVAHLDHDPTNCDPANLMAMCQLHHLAYDAPEKARRRSLDRVPEVFRNRP